jgi:mono/diheme cytochrome c family protein
MKTARLAFILAVVAAAPALAAPALVERGRYLVNGIAACGNCHTQKGPQGPLPGMDLAGGQAFPEKLFTAFASNITPDADTGIGKWTDVQIIRALREGRRPDDSIIGPPMPIALYRGISDADAQAIAAYLRSVPAVKHIAPKSNYRAPLPTSYGPPLKRVAEVPRSNKVAYGRYLAGPLGHCMECHSKPRPDGSADLVNGLGAGGMVFTGPWGESKATNLTPTALGKWTDDEIKRVITTGTRPDGKQLKPPMGMSYYANMSTADLDALVAYLRTLPPK